jgi:hypothetical protein
VGEWNKVGIDRMSGRTRILPEEPGLARVIGAIDRIRLGVSQFALHMVSLSQSPGFQWELQMRHINVRAHSDLLSPFEFEPHEKMRLARRSVALGRHLLCEKWRINPNVSPLWLCDSFHTAFVLMRPALDSL